LTEAKSYYEKAIQLMIQHSLGNLMLLQSLHTLTCCQVELRIIYFFFNETHVHKKKGKIKKRKNRKYLNIQ